VGLDEEAKAAQEIAKATGKITDAAREVGGFIARYIGGPLEQGLGIFEDKLKYMRWERLQRLIERSEKYLRERGLTEPTRPVPLKVAIPLFQAASLEDDDELQDIYARLLANAADAKSGVDVRRTYISILEDFGPMEARVLRVIYDAPDSALGLEGVWTKELPERALSLMPDDPDGEGRLPDKETQFVLMNLARLGCLETGTLMGGNPLTLVFITPLGEGLIEACTLRVNS